MNNLRKTWITLLMSLLSVSLLAQTTDCPTLVQTALDRVDETCADIGRNQACYGNTLIDLEPQTDSVIESFDIPGDTILLSDVAMMTLAPLDEATETWGVAMMKLQANIPNTLPGQNVTFLLFGDVVIENASTDDSEFMPMQAFYFSSGIGDAGCEEAPESGLLIQTPDGVEEILLNVNGANMSLGSTAFLQAGKTPDSEEEFELTISVLEGEGTIEAFDEVRPIPAGSWIRLETDRNFNVIGIPDNPIPYQSDVHSRLPIRGLERQFEVQPPLTENELNQRLAEFNPESARERLQNLGANLNQQPIRERDEERGNRLGRPSDNPEPQDGEDNNERPVDNQPTEPPLDNRQPSGEPTERPSGDNSQSSGEPTKKPRGNG